MDQIALIAQDPLARAGLAGLLSQLPEWTLWDQGPAEPGFLDLLAASDSEVILWDLGWDPEDALEILPDLLSLGLPILALSPEPEADADLLAQGVKGLLARQTGPEQLAAALAGVGHGLLVADPAVAERWPGGGEVAPLPALAEPLTPREQEVLQLLAEGLTNRAIARQLAISDHTVKFHVNALLNKLEAQSRTEAVVRAARLGLLFL